MARCAVPVPASNLETPKARAWTSQRDVPTLRSQRNAPAKRQNGQTEEAMYS